MGSPSTVCVDDDFATSKSSIAHGSTSDEAARRVDVVDGIIVQHVLGDDVVDNHLLDGCLESFLVDFRTVLSRHDNSVHTLRDALSVNLGVLDGDLGLGVRAQPGENLLLAALNKALAKAGGKLVGKRHHLRGFVSGISEHMTLISGSNVLGLLHDVDSRGNLSRLLLDGDHDGASLVIKSLLGVIESNLADGLADNLLVVNHSIAADLAKDKDDTSGGGTFASNLGMRVNG